MITGEYSKEKHEANITPCLAYCVASMAFLTLLLACFA
jgi:hypothetical protein